MLHRLYWAAGLAFAGVLFAGPAYAQRADENAVRAAGDAFGISVGNERIGLYTDRDVRGFSPVTAGNVRLDGFYYDERSNIPSRLIQGSQIRVGLTAQNYPFPAPTGIADFSLRDVRDQFTVGTFFQAGPNEGWSAEVDFRAPIDGARFGVAGGLFIRHEAPIPGQGVDPWGMGLVARWRPAPGTEGAAFYGYGNRLNSRANALVFMSGPYLPPEIESRAFTQEWTQSDGYIETYGAYLRHRLDSHWDLGASLFRFNNGGQGQTFEFFLGTDQNGLAATHRFSDQQPADTRNISAELRLTGTYTTGDFRHTVLGALRGRDQRQLFGGSSTINYGPAQLGVRTDIPQPVFTYGPQSRDNATQYTLGLGYNLAWRRWAQASFGIQRAEYEKRITTSSGVTVTADSPTLPNVSLAITAIPRVVLYAGWVQGLEEAPPAPEFAANASQAPPAIRTEQYDFGVRFAITPRLSLVAGYFDIEKPYFQTDSSNFYRELGIQHHSGVELSLAGMIGERLNVVAGAVLMNPRVEGPSVQSGAIGPWPISQAERTYRINVDYRTPWVSGLSLDAALTHTGPRAVSSRTYAELGGRQLFSESVTTLDLGARYRFRIGETSSTLRAQVTNVTDENAWRVFNGGVLAQSEPRSFLLSLATDF